MISLPDTDPRSRAAFWRNVTEAGTRAEPAVRPQPPAGAAPAGGSTILSTLERVQALGPLRPLLYAELERQGVTARTFFRALTR